MRSLKYKLNSTVSFIHNYLIPVLGQWFLDLIRNDYNPLLQTNVYFISAPHPQQAHPLHTRFYVFYYQIWIHIQMDHTVHHTFIAHEYIWQEYITYTLFCVFSWWFCVIILCWNLGPKYLLEHFDMTVIIGFVYRLYIPHGTLYLEYK